MLNLPPLIFGTLIKRYKRFFVDVLLEDGREVIAHCPNSGAMLGVLDSGNRVALTFNSNPARKLAYTWQLVEAEGTWIGVNTHLTNEIAAVVLKQQLGLPSSAPNTFSSTPPLSSSASHISSSVPILSSDLPLSSSNPPLSSSALILPSSAPLLSSSDLFRGFKDPNNKCENDIEKEECKDLLPGLSRYSHIQREVKYGTNSRIDFLLTGDGLPPCYLEVKNVHLKRNDIAQFPDCVTARGAKHMAELALMRQQGMRCVVLYIVQRGDVKKFALAADIDPTYAKASEIAKASGVEMLALGCEFDVVKEQLSFCNRLLTC